MMNIPTTSTGPTEIRIAGKTMSVPSAEICGRTVVVTGKGIRTAQIKDEQVVEGISVVDPESFIVELKQSKLNADIFTFTQRPLETAPKYDYHFDWDNWAAISITSFNDWWENRLPQESRKNVRRAAKRGVSLRVVPFDDELVTGIHRIYNETPVRQGRRFWHFGKDVETVKRELATYLDRSTFIGAYCSQEMIGFLKMVYVNGVAILFHILSMNAHYDKRPMNALIAKAVEVCEQERISHFVYGQFVYGNKHQSSLVEFKRRNGFEQINFPRYYVPLTVRGAAFVRLKLYRGLGGLLPEPVLQRILSCRAWCSELLSAKRTLRHTKFAGVAQRQSG
jgi:hypothetical protein